MRAASCRLVIALSLVLIAVSSARAAEDVPRRAEALAFNCLACHGPNAEGPDDMKSLRTLSAAEIRRKLTAYRRDENDPTIMNRIAKAYSDDEIALIADYIANLD